MSTTRLIKSDVTANRNNNIANLYGVTAFIDAFDGYIETGYGLVQGIDDQVDGQLTNFLTAAYTRRFANTLSNSTRVFANFGDGENDDGFCHHFGEQHYLGLAEHAAPLRQLLRRLREPSAPGRWQWRGHTEERRHQLRNRRPDRLPETQRHRLQRLWRRDRLAVSLQSGSAARLRTGHGAALRRSDRRHRRRGRRNMPRVFAIRSRSTGPGCSAPMRPIRSSRAPTKTTSASAPRSAGSSEGAPRAGICELFA